MTTNKALHTWDDVDRLYLSRKEGWRGLARIQNSVNTSIRRLKEYIKKELRKTYHNDSKQHEDQQYNNN